MRIRCLHGYFIFQESSAGEISKFMSLFEGLSIVAQDDFYTFETLQPAPTYSLAGGTYLGADTALTFEGKPWDVMRMNELVYNFQTDEVVALQSVTQVIDLDTAANYFISPGLILPGSLLTDGTRVTDYVAYFLFGSNKFRYSEVSGV